MTPDAFYLRLGILAFQAGLITGIVDIYFSQTEVEKLIGAPANLYYVRKGIFNYNAMTYYLPVPPKVQELNVHWQSFTESPLAYLINFNISDKSLLPHPKLNISNKGVIPTENQSFHLIISCSNDFETSVNVSIIIDLNYENSSTVTINLRKKCFTYDIVQTVPSVSKDVTFLDAVYQLGIAIAVVTLTAVILGGSYILVQYKKCSFPSKSITSSGQNNEPPNNHVSLKAEAIPGKEINLYQPVTIDIEQIDFISTVLKGTFSKVSHAVLLSDNGEREEVYVKSVLQLASSEQVSCFEAEGLQFAHLNHINILPVRALLHSPGPTFAIAYPYMDEGNLKRFLQNCRCSSDGPQTRSLLTQQVVSLALQVVHGMVFLHKEKMLHRDLATRNCMVDSELRLKVTDTALSRDLFPGDYICLGDNENRPVGWLAHESLVQREFSTASDVWAFGVLFWELATLAQQPYHEIDPFDLAGFLKEGYRLTQPHNCPDEMFSVMAYCWTIIPEERPTFQQLCGFLEDFLKQLNKYV